MSRFSPTVVPNGVNPLAEALRGYVQGRDLRQQRQRQDDLDALQTGVGLSTVDPNVPTPPPSGAGFMPRLASKLLGRSDPDAAASANWVRNTGNAMADTGAQGSHAVLAATLRSTVPTLGNIVAPPKAQDNAQLADALRAQVPTLYRLPSGKTVDSRLTPWGRQQAALQDQRTFELQAKELERKRRREALLRAGIPEQYIDGAIEAPQLMEHVQGSPFAKPQVPSYEPVTGEDAQGNPIVYRFNKQTGHMEPTGFRAKSPKDPTPHYTTVVTTGPDGSQKVSRFNTLTGQIEDTGVDAKRSQGGAGSAQGAQVPVADMEARYREIADHAAALGQGEWQLTRPMQVREGLDYSVTRDNAKGDPSVTHSVLSAGAGGLGLGGKDYGRYQALMNSTRALGDDVAKVFKGRQNEESVLREVALSALTPDDYKNEAVVKQKLDRLRHVIDLARMNNPSQLSAVAPPPSRPAPGALSPDKAARARRDPKYADFLKSQGYSF